MPTSSTTSSSMKRKSASNGRKARKRKQYSPRSFLECQSITHVVGFPPQHELVTTPVVSEFVKELFLDRFVKEIVKAFQPDRMQTKQDQGLSKTTAPTTTESNSGYYHVMVGGKLVKRRRTSQDRNQPNRTATTKATLEQNPQNDSVTNELDRKRRIWKENIVFGTNQCLRLLEYLYNRADCREKNDAAVLTAQIQSTENKLGKPSLVVIAKDIYPPTMCCAVPVLAKKLGIPLLVLPGKASLELGRALNARRTSILIFCCGDNNEPCSDKDGDSDIANVLGGKVCHDKEMSESRAAIASFVSFIKDQIPQNDNSS